MECLLHKHYYFKPGLLTLKSYHDLGLLAPNRYESDLLNEVLNVLIGQTAAKLQACKVGEQKKKLRQFGFEATFFATLCSKLLLSEGPGFESRQAQTLKAYIFEASWPTKPKTNLFERFDLFLLR